MHDVRNRVRRGDSWRWVFVAGGVMSISSGMYVFNSWTMPRRALSTDIKHAAIGLVVWSVIYVVISRTWGRNR